MKKAALRVVWLSVILFLMVGCKKEESSSAQNIEKENLNKNATKKCTVKDCAFEIPRDWEVNADDDGGDYGNDVVQLGVVSMPIDNKLSMDDKAVQEYVENAVLSAGNNYEINQTEMTTVASELGYRIYSISGQDINTISTAFCSEDNLFIFNFIYKPDGNIDYTAYYDEVIASIKMSFSKEKDKTGNKLLDAKIDIEPSYSGSGEVIGNWGKYSLAKEELKSLTQEQFKEFMNQRVMGTLIGVVDYANIVFDDGTVLHFTPGTEIVDYGEGDEDGSLVNTKGFVVLRDGQYMYEQK